jgi:hypothetical protein
MVSSVAVFITNCHQKWYYSSDEHTCIMPVFEIGIKCFLWCGTWVLNIIYRQIFRFQ